MKYRLRDDLTCCRVGNTYVFLDVRNDKYLQLSGRLEKDFDDYLRNNQFCAAPLVRKGILVESSGCIPKDPFPVIDPPTRSAFEGRIDGRSNRPSSLVEVAGLLLMTRFHLLSRSFRTNLASLQAYRRKRSDPGLKKDASEVLEAVASFHHARLQLPVEPTCLLDTIAITKFLSRRGVSAQMVIGVKLNPFSAHCWAQSNQIVLNETLGDAVAYTPIMVV